LRVPPFFGYLQMGYSPLTPRNTLFCHEQAMYCNPQCRISSPDARLLLQLFLAGKRVPLVISSCINNNMNEFTGLDPALAFLPAPKISLRLFYGVGLLPVEVEV